MSSENSFDQRARGRLSTSPKSAHSTASSLASTVVARGRASSSLPDTPASVCESEELTTSTGKVQNRVTVLPAVLFHLCNLHQVDALPTQLALLLTCNLQLGRQEMQRSLKIPIRDTDIRLMPLLARPSQQDLQACQVAPIEAHHARSQYHRDRQHMARQHQVAARQKGQRTQRRGTGSM